MAKTVTREQAERKKTQAAAFMERIGEDDRASEFDDMSVDEYAERRGLQIANPRRKARKTTMAGSGLSKAELQDAIDSAVGVLDEAYAPEATREELAAAIGQALDILNGKAIATRRKRTWTTATGTKTRGNSGPAVRTELAQGSPATY